MTLFSQRCQCGHLRSVHERKGHFKDVCTTCGCSYFKYPRETVTKMVREGTSGLPPWPLGSIPKGKEVAG